MQSTGCRTRMDSIPTARTTLQLVRHPSIIPIIADSAAENFVYQGGDDCVALKPNSTSITLRNITCYGGTGIAFGSIGQYEGVVSAFRSALSLE
jgi:hypothetical protein